jgi:transaldolase
MATAYPTDYRNDSCSIAELTYAIDDGAVGAMSNPTIVGAVMGQEYDYWAPRVVEIAVAHPTWIYQQVTWRLMFPDPDRRQG